MRSSSLAAALALFIFSCSIFCSTLHAQAVSIDKINAEVQRVESGPQRFLLIWWIPTEYWEAVFKNDPSINEAAQQAFYKAIENYIVVSVVDGDTSELGNVRMTSKDQIASKLFLTIGENQRLAPLRDSEVALDAKSFFAMMKPAFSSTLGQLGEGVEFFYFKGLDAAGKRAVDPRAQGILKVSYAEKEYTWRLPLGSFLPPKFDADTGEQFPGNYLFSPFTGKPLGLNRP